MNGQLDQKHQQQLEQLRQRQDQERQRIEQKQVQEQQKIQDRIAARFKELGGMTPELSKKIGF